MKWITEKGWWNYAIKTGQDYLRVKVPYLNAEKDDSFKRSICTSSRFWFLIWRKKTLVKIIHQSFRYSSLINWPYRQDIRGSLSLKDSPWPSWNWKKSYKFKLESSESFMNFCIQRSRNCEKMKFIVFECRKKIFLL